MAASEFVCEQCRESIDGAASTCPHCGHDPGRSEELRAAGILGIAALLCLSVIGLPIGVYLGYKGYQKRTQVDEITPSVEK